MQTIKQRRALSKANRPLVNGMVGKEVRFNYGSTGIILSVEGRWFTIKLQDGQVRRFLRDQFNMKEAS